MNLKHAILGYMHRDTLKQAVDDLGLDGVDRRSVEDMAAKLSRSHRATSGFLLDYMGEQEVKAVCEEVGVSSVGQRGELVKRLLRAWDGRAERRGRTSLPRARGKTDQAKSTRQKGSRSMPGVEDDGVGELEVEPPVRLPEPPPGMMRVTRTELVWPGKYNEDGTLKEVPRVNLPFQVIERVNESRATREARKERPQLGLFDVWQGQEGDTFEEGWRNKLIWGDNLLVMGSLLEKFAGKIDLIYIDPPFATGADFSFTTEIGEAGDELEKEQSAIEEKAYRDTWGRGLDSYLEMMTQRLALMHTLLSPNGSLYVHVDANMAPYIRLLLREELGGDAFRNEIYWYYTNKIPDTRKRLFTKSTDTILFYAVGENQFEHQEEEREVPIKVSRMRKVQGKKIYVRGEDGKVEMIERNTRVVDNVWRIAMLHAQPEITGFPTQKPEALLERVIKASSNADSLVADFFCGSGTTLAVAEKLGRRWIGCDLGRWGMHVTRKRLLGIENCRPFEVLNLGKYERQYWQGVTFGDKRGKPPTERALYEYLAFILKLYGGKPVAGMAQIHGRKGRALIHIGAVDAPVTISEIDGAVEECAKLKQGELHVLGWEWEMGLAGPNNDVRKPGPVQDMARAKGVKLSLLQIPREVMEQQAAAKGDVRFFELAYLEAKVDYPKKLAARVILRDFVIANTELIPEEVREKANKWSDYIDYWAVDWDFLNDTFMQGWVTYRTRKDRKLLLASEPHTYAKLGRYRILVKVIDIFGNDTSQAFDVEVK